MRQMLLVGVVVGVLLGAVQALDNGLARTPPMGWLSWERFGCNTDCKTHPDSCISENLYRRIADEMVAGGYKAAGYEYVCIDDCWLAKTRDSNDRLQPDPDRFPSGMKNLSDYIHSQGLKFGIYEDFGSKTCAGFPGSEFYLQLDAQTFADWGVDLLKFDGCNSDIADMDQGYPLMSQFLNKTGRPILFSCEWPFYKTFHGLKPNYTAARQYCNMWRTSGDISDSWDSIKGIIQEYAENKDHRAEAAGPGGFNDPDELVVGDFGLSYDQQKTQFGMWAMWSAAMLMSVDLRGIDPKSRAILLNKEVIAINQDPLGVQALAMWKSGQVTYWMKPLSKKGSYALAFTSDAEGFGPSYLSIYTGSLMLPQMNYTLFDLFESKNVGVISLTQKVVITVNPSGIVLLKAIPV